MLVDRRIRSSSAQNPDARGVTGDAMVHIQRLYMHAGDGAMEGRAEQLLY